MSIVLKKAFFFLSQLLRLELNLKKGIYLSYVLKNLISTYSYAEEKNSRIGDSTQAVAVK